MTTFDRFERVIPDLMTELAPARVPDYLDDMLRQTARTRQRPAWSALERWLPMGVLARTGSLRTFSLRPILVLALVGLLIVAALAAISVASQPRVPAPFGPAANGTMFYHGTEGAIYAADPATGATTAVITGPDLYSYPLPSRDGRRIKVEQRTGAASTLLVADADGSDLHPLAGTYSVIGEVDWSPDDRQIAITSVVYGVRSLSIIEADGSAMRTLPLDRDILSFSYLPDGRLAFIGSEQPSGSCHGDVSDVCALFVVDADGTGLRTVLAAADFGGLAGLSPTPDGRSLAYVRWRDGETGRLRVVDIENSQDREVRIDGIPPDEWAANRVYVSPDGTKILFDHFGVTEDHWAVVPFDGGAVTDLGPAWAGCCEGHGPAAGWSPDGRSVLAYQPTSLADSEIRVLDATGQGNDQTLSLSTPNAPAWQRLAP